MKKRLVVVAFLAGVIAAGAARAQTPPTCMDQTITGKPLDPNGDDWGCVPTSVDVLKCESQVARNLRKLVKCIGIRCHKKQATSTFKNIPFSEEACEVKCRQGYRSSNLRLVGCDACLGDTQREALGQQVEDFMDQHNGDVFCAGTVPFGDDDTGFIPPGLKTLNGEGFVAKQFALATACIFKCHIRAVDGAFGGGTWVDEPCETLICNTKYERLNAEVDVNTPSCLKKPQRDALFTTLETFVDQLNGSIFCSF